MITASDTAGPAVGPDTDPVLSARGLVKRYGNVTAIRGSDFDLFPGEVLAIVGDNGAGKSSLIKALTGALIPDSGTITLNGEEIRFGSPADARNRGIETVYQTLAVAPALDIATNLFLGREIRRRACSGGCTSSTATPCEPRQRNNSTRSASPPFRTSPSRWRVFPVHNGKRSPSRVPRCSEKCW
jgi:ABC-type branched-subunit amino acid transport system ATPase component